MSCTKVSIENTFRKMLLLSSKNINDYVTHIYRKYAELDVSNTKDLDEHNMKYLVMLYNLQKLGNRISGKEKEVILI